MVSFTTRKSLPVEIETIVSAHERWLQKLPHGQKADFSGMNLSEMDFSGRHLAYANFSHANLKDAQFPAAELQNANFQNANCTRTNFAGAELINADFTKTKLKATNFSAATINAKAFYRQKVNLKEVNEAQLPQGTHALWVEQRSYSHAKRHRERIKSSSEYSR